jgi:hypothetical protein
MDEEVACLLSRPLRTPGGMAASSGVGADFGSGVPGAMDKQEPLDKPFLVFVVIVAICLVALGYVLYPN